jgi:Flp pilus assembly protein TadD
MSYVRSGTLVADHYQYFADVSLIALFCAGIAKLWAWQKNQMRIQTAAVVFLLLGAMGTYTWTRAEVYRNEETLWEDNLSKNPDAWQAHNRLGQRFFNQEKYVEAAPHFELAARLKPELADNYNQLGLVYCRLGRFEEGIAEYRKGLRLKEAKSSTANDAGTAKMEANLANALTITAIHMTETAQTFSPNTSAIAAAQADEGRRRYGEAVQAYEKALELDPRQPAVHRNLGILLVRLGRYDEAVIHLRATLQLVPNEPLARETLDALEAHRR